MEDSLEIRAKTVAEAIQRALEQLSVSREEVEITVVKEGRSGILGLGAEDAVVRVKPKVTAPKNDVSEVARNVLEKLLSLLGVGGAIVSPAPPIVDEEAGVTAPITFNVRGDDLGLLIGRRGQTLAALQYVVRLIVSQQTKTWASIVIDVEEYKQRRYEVLRALARRMAEQVKAKGAPFTLEPMPAYERRIVHMTLADHPDVTTQSTGQGETRQVVILPRKS